MLRMLVVVRERVVELGIREATRVVGGGEGEKRTLAAGELEQRRTHAERLAQPARYGPSD
jgi:hypothetical protein